MGKKTGVGWTGSTFSGWRGCTEIGPGCFGCYAKAIDGRFYGGEHWGPGAPRLLAGDKYWSEPLKWNRKAEKEGIFWPVFCASQSDVFDNEVPQEWRDRLWALIKATPHLTWQMVTKRIGNAARMLPADWGTGYPNVWIIATVVNQEEAERDIHKLKSVPAVVHGLSVEPMLEQINLEVPDVRHGGSLIDGIQWVIVGGESTQGSHRAREFHLEWGTDLLEQCDRAGVPAFFKQMGHSAMSGEQPIRFVGKGANLVDWPSEFRRQEFPFGLRLAA